MNGKGLSYDGGERLSRSPLGTPETFAYDAANRLTTQKASGVTDSFTYDKASELTAGGSGAQTSDFGYDPVGDRTSASSGGVTVAYGYDQAAHLTNYVQSSTSASYAYNGQGLRMWKTVDGKTEHFAWDVASGVPRLLDAGSTAYVDGPGMAPLEQIAPNNRVSYLHQDQLGSTVMLTGATGGVTATYAYDAYGNVTAHAGSASTPLQYAGGYSDPESGLVYFQSRYYDPATKQFLTVDPLAGRTQQRYAYAGDDPANAIDPTGAAPGFTGEYGSWTVLSGHGQASGLQFTVPPGASVTFFGPPGMAISDRLGNAIESGNVGTSSGNGGPPIVYTQTYTEGMTIPNYVLLPPDGLSLQANENTVTVTSPTMLSDLVQANGGMYAWAACRVGEPGDLSLTGGDSLWYARLAHNDWDLAGGSLGSGVWAKDLNDPELLKASGVKYTVDPGSGVIEIRQEPTLLPANQSYDEEILGSSSAS